MIKQVAVHKGICLFASAFFLALAAACQLVPVVILFKYFSLVEVPASIYSYRLDESIYCYQIYALFNFFKSFTGFKVFTGQRMLWSWAHLLINLIESFVSLTLLIYLLRDVFEPLPVFLTSLAYFVTLIYTFSVYRMLCLISMVKSSGPLVPLCRLHRAPECAMSCNVILSQFKSPTNSGVPIQVPLFAGGVNLLSSIIPENFKSRAMKLGEEL